MCWVFTALIGSIHVPLHNFQLPWTLTCIFSSLIIIHLLVFLFLNASATSPPHLLPPSKETLHITGKVLLISSSPLFKNLYNFVLMLIQCSKGILDEVKPISSLPMKFTSYFVHIISKLFLHMFWDVSQLITVGSHLFDLIHRFLSEHRTPLHHLFLKYFSQINSWHTVMTQTSLIISKIYAVCFITSRPLPFSPTSWFIHSFIHFYFPFPVVGSYPWSPTPGLCPLFYSHSPV